jgi:hypothetical protein
MSAEELSKLSLVDTMVTTRAAAARARTAPAQQAQLHSASPSPPDSSAPSASPTHSVIESASGIRYNVASLEAETRRRLEQGLQDSDIKMKYCRLLDDDESNQYLFYLDDEIQVAMGGEYEVPKCTCGANEGGIACKVNPGLWGDLQYSLTHFAAYLLDVGSIGI